MCRMAVLRPSGNQGGAWERPFLPAMWEAAEPPCMLAMPVPSPTLPTAPAGDLCWRGEGVTEGAGSAADPVRLCVSLWSRASWVFRIWRGFSLHLFLSLRAQRTSRSQTQEQGSQEAVPFHHARGPGTLRGEHSSPWPLPTRDWSAQEAGKVRGWFLPTPRPALDTLPHPPQLSATGIGRGLRDPSG